MTSSHWPVKIRLLKGEKKVEIEFEDGDVFVLSAEYLRISSPSAEVQGHHPAQKILVSGKEKVALTHMESVGNYAVRFIFDDGHDSGIYSWNYLYELGEHYRDNWQRYLADLKEQGLHRHHSGGSF